MEFRILGPLEVRDGDAVLEVRGEKQRALLAVLLLSAGSVVSTDRLIEELWGDEPPSSGATALQVRVSQLRKALTQTGADDPIATRAPGYAIRADGDQLDLRRFERLLGEAQAASSEGDPATASDKLRSALRLWRGSPLSDLGDAEFARPAIARLEDLRLAALELRIDADLALERHAQLVGELQGPRDRAPEQGEVQGAADARAVSCRPPVGGARCLSGRPPVARRGVRDRAEPRAARARRLDSAARPRAREARSAGKLGERWHRRAACDRRDDVGRVAARRAARARRPAGRRAGPRADPRPALSSTRRSCRKRRARCTPVAMRSFARG